MKFSLHATIRFQERLSITEEDFINRLQTQAVLERIEKDGPSHYIIYIPEDSEYYCVVIAKDTIITMMPLIWRCKQISPEILDQARKLVIRDEIKQEVTKEPVKQTVATHKKNPKTECSIAYDNNGHRGTLNFGSKAFYPQLNKEWLRKEVEEVTMEKYNNALPEKVLGVRARLNGVWTNIIL